MLNYVWISLLLIGIFTAVGRDINDEVTNTYRNGVPVTAQFETLKQRTSVRPAYNGEIILSAASFNQFYNTSAAQLQQSEIRQTAILTTLTSGKQKLEIPISDATPAFWKEMAEAAGGKDKLEADVISFDNGKKEIIFTMERVTFVKIKAVTKAAIEYSNTAVTISLSLIGVMALWLGIMKVGEAAGLLELLTKVVAPVTRRLFPDVPPNHPAVGAMIMNIAANMFGLNNAATPMGLKAMEELNKLNPKAGTATNAMCTFLVINTSGLTLIPATVIAIRAGLGSADPGIIIGTSIFGAACATTAGLIAVKILQRLPRYKKELIVEDENAEVKNG
ncbi:MAG: nucleoside recognition domain-containing protein [Bacteroidota bacterium]|nr:nucleoside recognition domain-containing protein [Bacteroidota bacterium]